jgi:hypothetical protein
MSSTIHPRGTPSYDHLLSHYYNALLPPTRPLEIHQPTTLTSVISAMTRANTLSCPIGVRSGGHLYAATSLVPDGILIDTSLLDPTISYSAEDGSISLGPGMRSLQLAEGLDKVGRFFPVGHAGSVGIGGFLLAGGQGWFMRGWGCSAEWITALEIVTAKGEVVTASAEQNQDLFYVARGSGQGFFGVVTRVFARTIQRKRIWRRTRAFDSTTREEFGRLLSWMLAANEETQKWGVDVAAITAYEQGDSGRVLMYISTTAFSDSREEAERMLAAFSTPPSPVISQKPLAERSWESLLPTPPAGREIWHCDNILSKPGVPREQLVDALFEPLCQLPTRKSTGLLFVGDTIPDEKRMAFSLPCEYYVATYAAGGGEDVRSWLKDSYAKLQDVAVGSFVADYDPGLRRAKVFCMHSRGFGGGKVDGTDSW